MHDFGLNIDQDIISATGDGAAVMIAFGRLFKFTYLKCWNHAIHLAISDIIYSNKFRSFGFQFIENASDSENSNVSQNSEEDLSNDDSFSDESESDTETNADSDDDVIDTNIYGNVIRKMRMIVKLFRLSPVRNSILQKNIKKMLGSELSLILDTPTRWNSLFESATRFLRVVDCIIQTLSHKEINKAAFWSENDTKILQVCSYNI